MNEPNKELNQANPESYKPEVPKLTGMLEELSAEKVIDAFVVEGVEFTLIEKPKTLYAGVYRVVDDINWQPSTYSWGPFDDGMTDKEKEVLQLIRGGLTPDCMITLNIDYSTKERPCAELCGQETTSREQPEGITVIEAEPSLYIRVRHTHEAFALTKKLTGKYLHQYHMLDLHDLIKHLFCDGDGYVFEPNGSKQNGNEDMQIVYSNEVERYAAVPVKVKSGFEKAPVKLNIEYPYSTESPFKNNVDFTKTLAEIDASQKPLKEFEKMTFGGQDWLVLEKEDSRALIIKEKISENRRYHHMKTEITWAECELRSYLNGEYYNSFNEQDKARIIKTRVTTPTQPWHGTDGGADTEDYIFIPSVQEAVKYFGGSDDFEIRKGWWASMEGLWLGNAFGQVLYDQYNRSRSAQSDGGGENGWLLRSPGRLNVFIMGIGSNGHIGFTGYNVDSGHLGIRPAMWVRL